MQQQKFNYKLRLKCNEVAFADEGAFFPQKLKSCDRFRDCSAQLTARLTIKISSKHGIARVLHFKVEFTTFCESLFQIAVWCELTVFVVSSVYSFFCI